MRWGEERVRWEEYAAKRPEKEGAHHQEERFRRHEETQRVEVILVLVLYEARLVKSVVGRSPK